MNTPNRFEQYRLVMVQPWRERFNAGWPWGITLIALVLLAMLGLSLAINEAHDAQMLRGIVALIALLLLWLHQQAGLFAQNDPQLARLMPAQVRRLRELSVGMSLLSMGMAAAIGAWLHGEPWLYMGAWLLTGWSLSLMIRGVWQAHLLWVIASTAGLWVDSAAFAWLKELVLAWRSDAPWTLALALLLMAVFLMQREIGNGDAAHQAHDLRRRRAIEQLKRQAQGAERVRVPDSGWGRRLRDALESPYWRWLERLVARRVAGPQSAMARAELALGPSGHWTMQVAAAALVLVVMLLAVLLSYPWWSAELLEAVAHHGQIGLTIGLISLAINPLMSLRIALYRSRHEQALLMLAPGMPQGRQLNRMLATRLLRRFAIATAAAMLLMGGIDRLAGAPGGYIGFAVVMLPCCLALIRDWSRVGPPGSSYVAQSLIALLVVGPLLNQLVARGQVSGAWLLGVTATVVGLLGWRAWRQLDRQPAAFPVGRLAKLSASS